MTDEDVVIWYNPRCSKCRGAEDLLAAYGVSSRQLRYLEDPPPREEIVRVLGLLDATGPREMMRTKEPRYTELGLDGASDNELIDAMAAHPELIERPIVIREDRAVIARPPELLLSLLDR
ncbi:MAG TPA: arsenate reductase (glutaredoxin) [Nocardioidaceae bacterium]